VNVSIRHRSTRIIGFIAAAGLVAFGTFTTEGRNAAAAVAGYVVSSAVQSAAAAGPALPADAGVTPEIVAAGKKEGEVTYYTSEELPHANRLKAEFEKKYGIKVNVLRMSSNLLNNRTVQEFDSGIHVVDVLMLANVEHFDNAKAKGMLQSFTPATIKFYTNPVYYDPAHFWHAVRLAPSTINYNKNLVKGDMIPKTWKDLVDPRFKNKLAQGNPRASSTTAVIDFNLVKLYGWQYFEALKKNNIMTQQSCSQPNLISSGERLMIPCDYGISAAARLENLPIASVFPQDGVFVIVSPVAVMAKAPHPNAAKVFLNWVLSSEGQTLYTHGGMISPLDTDEVKYPADFPDRKSLKLITTSEEEYRKWVPGGLEKFAELFGG